MTNDFKERLSAGKFSEDAVSRFVVSQLVDEMRYAPRTKEGFVWNGYIWEPDHRNSIRAAIRATVSDFVEDYWRLAQSWAMAPQDDGVPRTPEAFPKYKKAAAFLAKGKHEAVHGFATSDPRVTIRVEDFDTKANLLATPSGEVDLRTGELFEPDPAHLFTRATKVGFDANSEAPRFERFIEEITDSDDDLGRYLQKLIGAAMFGNIHLQKFFIWEGAGANGKDTLAEVVERVLGDYFGRGAENMLIVREHDEHPAEVYALRGRRLVVHSETDKGRKLNLGRVKEFTGTPQITARPMRGNPVTFENTWTHILLTNHLPILGGDLEYGTLRRIVVVPFVQTFYAEGEGPEGARIREDGLGEKIAEAEGPGVLRWLVEGARLYSEEGLRACSAVKDATDAYLEDVQDPFGVWAWLQTETEEGDPSEFTTTEKIEIAYLAWARFQKGDYRVASGQQLGKQLTKRGYPSSQKKVEEKTADGSKKVNKRGRYGLTLKADRMPTVSELQEMASA